jgi:hypothetical protein
MAKRWERSAKKIAFRKRGQVVSVFKGGEEGNAGDSFASNDLIHKV